MLDGVTVKRMCQGTPRHPHNASLTGYLPIFIDHISIFGGFLGTSKIFFQGQ